MKPCKPVEISTGAFNFCKYSIAFILWASVLLKSKELVLLCFVILVISAILKVKKAPLVYFYTQTFQRHFKSQPLILDENSVWFAHTVGAVVSALALVFLYFINPFIGWVITIVLAILKTSGAFGFCGAMKLYGCMNNPNGNCCRMGKKIKKQCQ